MNKPVGLFADRSAAAYRRAAEAVQAGNPTAEQRAMNESAAKVAGRNNIGSDARAAKEGRLLPRK